MKRHLLTIILLLLAAIAFVMRFSVVVKWQVCCDLIAFALPTLAALVEIFISEKSGREIESEIKTLKKNQLSVHVEGETLYYDKGV